MVTPPLLIKSIAELASLTRGMQSQAEVFHLGRAGNGHSCHVALTTSDPVGSAASPLACRRNLWIAKNDPTSLRPNDIGAIGARRVVAGTHIPRGRHGPIRPHVGRTRASGVTAGAITW